MNNRKHARLAVFLLLGIITLGSVSAVSYSAGISLGLRDTSLYDYVVSPSVEAEVGDFEFGINFAEDKWIDAGVSYNGHGKNTFRYQIGSGLHQVYTNGGMWALTADVGQEFLLGNHWILKYMIGAQLGLSWGPYSSENIQFSQSPYIELEAGYTNDFFTGKIYWVGDKLYERTWQSLPIIGTYLSFNIGESHSLFIDTYFKVADYMAKPTPLISGTEMRIGYKYHGGEN